MLLACHPPSVECCWHALHAKPASSLTTQNPPSQSKTAVCSGLAPVLNSTALQPVKAGPVMGRPPQFVVRSGLPQCMPAYTPTRQQLRYTCLRGLAAVVRGATCESKTCVMHLNGHIYYFQAALVT